MICSVNIREWYEAETEIVAAKRDTGSGTKQLGALIAQFRHKKTEASQLGALYAQQRHTAVNAETLSRMWNVGLETAQRTLRATTQNGVQPLYTPSPGAIVLIIYTCIAND